MGIVPFDSPAQALRRELEKYRAQRLKIKAKIKRLEADLIPLRAEWEAKLAAMRDGAKGGE